jgi:hypothetical protein
VGGGLHPHACFLYGIKKNVIYLFLTSKTIVPLPYHHSNHIPPHPTLHSYIVSFSHHLLSSSLPPHPTPTIPISYQIHPHYQQYKSFNSPHPKQTTPLINTPIIHWYNNNFFEYLASLNISYLTYSYLSCTQSSHPLLTTHKKIKIKIKKFLKST